MIKTYKPYINIYSGSFSAFIFTILISASCSAQNEDYSIMRSFFNQDTIHKNLSLNLTVPKMNGLSFEKLISRDFLKRNSSPETINMDVFFDEKDYTIMKEQLKKINQETKLNKSLLLSMNISFIDSLDEINEYKSFTGNVTKVSLPLLSKNKDKAIMYVENFCGDGCGHAAVYIFEKKKNSKSEWVILSNATVWSE